MKGDSHRLALVEGDDARVTGFVAGAFGRRGYRATGRAGRVGVSGKGGDGVGGCGDIYRVGNRDGRRRGYGVRGRRGRVAIARCRRGWDTGG